MVDAAVWFGAGVESAEASEPGVGSFDDPAVAGFGVASPDDFLAASGAGPWGLAGEFGVAGAAAAADSRGRFAGADGVAEGVAAVAAVGPDLFWLVAGLADGVEQRQQVRAFVLVAGPEPCLDGPAVRFDCEVVLGRGHAPVHRAGAGEITPLFASTIDASITSRDQSSLPARSSSATSVSSACSQTPLPIHSCNRRRHVSPLGKPSSRGRSMYRPPVYSRYKSPSRQARVGNLLRPALQALLGGSANNGAKRTQR